MNQICLVGRMTRDPELKDGGSYSLARFTIAVNRSRKKEGERDYPADFFRCTAWGRQAELIAKHFHKGRPIGISGELQINEYTDKEGFNRKSIDVQVDNFWFLPGAPKQEQSWHDQLGARPASEVVGTSETFLDAPDDQQLPFDF